MCKIGLRKFQGRRLAENFTGCHLEMWVTRHQVLQWLKGKAFDGKNLLLIEKQAQILAWRTRDGQ
jgi:hypothetical protein